MKEEYKEILKRAMPMLISQMEVDTPFLSRFQSAKILDDTAPEEIMVS